MSGFYQFAQGEGWSIAIVRDPHSGGWRVDITRDGKTKHVGNLYGYFRQETAESKAAALAEKLWAKEAAR